MEGGSRGKKKSRRLTERYTKVKKGDSAYPLGWGTPRIEKKVPIRHGVTVNHKK